MSTARAAALSVIEDGEPPADPAHPASPGDPAHTEAPLVRPEDILVIRRGPGANCSSIGSVLDVLFLSAVAGGAIFVGIAALLNEQSAEPRPEADPGTRDEDQDAPGAR